MEKPSLSILKGTFAIYKLPPETSISPEVFTDEFFSITRTAKELSIVCRQGKHFKNSLSEEGWHCLKVEGPLDFSLTGILAGILNPLAEEGISVFTLSTYDTDYILVKKDTLITCIHKLRSEGYKVKEPDYKLS